MEPPLLMTVAFGRRLKRSLFTPTNASRSQQFHLTTQRSTSVAQAMVPRDGGPESKGPGDECRDFASAPSLAIALGLVQDGPEHGTRSTPE